MPYRYQAIPNEKKRIRDLMEKINFVLDEKIIGLSDWIARSHRFYMPSGCATASRSWKKKGPKLPVKQPYDD